MADPEEDVQKRPQERRLKLQRLISIEADRQYLKKLSRDHPKRATAERLLEEARLALQENRLGDCAEILKKWPLEAQE